MTIMELLGQEIDIDTWEAIRSDEFMDERLLGLMQLERATPCGEQCRMLIYSAVITLQHLSDAEQDDEEIRMMLWRRVITTCSVYFGG